MNVMDKLYAVIRCIFFSIFLDIYLYFEQKLLMPFPEKLIQIELPFENNFFLFCFHLI